MTNREIMKKYILSNVVSALLENGFAGQFPHYRRIGQDAIDLITFQTNKHGGSFTVEVSAVFPHAEKTNCVAENIEAESVTVWDTNNRYRLKGMYDGWFYCQDLYAKRIIGFGKHYLAISEKQKANFAAPKSYKLVWEFNEDTAKMICDEINHQLKESFKWLDKFKKRNK